MPAGRRWFAASTVTNRKAIVMEKLVLQKVVTLAAALALESVMANDALAKGADRGQGGRGHHGGGVHHFVGSVRDHGFNAPRMGGDFLASQSGGNGTHGYNCWKLHGIPTNSAWRQRHADDGTCY